MLTFGALDLQEADGPPVVPGVRLYALARPLPVFMDGLRHDEIPAGFRTDKTSWPWWLKWVPVLGRKWLGAARYDVAAVYHDYLLGLTSRPKWECDLRYKYALRSTGVSALEAWIFGGAVRARRKR